ncbi:MAG: Ig-like domain-containing protein, partial [Thermoplasmata archaeon]
SDVHDFYYVKVKYDTNVSPAFVQILDVSVKPAPGLSLRIEIYTNNLQFVGPEATLVDARNSPSPGVAFNLSSRQWLPTNISNYYMFFRISTLSGSGIYNLTVSISNITQDNDNDFENASTVTSGQMHPESSVNASFAVDPEDYYKILAQPGQKVKVILAKKNWTATWAASNNLDVYLYGPLYELLNSSAGQNLPSEEVSWIVNSSGTGYYYARVVATAGGGDYWLNFSVNKPPRILEYSPVELSRRVNEGQSLSFSVDVSDSDGPSIITYQWYAKTPSNSSFRALYGQIINRCVYTPEEGGTTLLKVEIYDGVDYVNITWTLDVNPKPVLSGYGSTTRTLYEGNQLSLIVIATDNTDVNYSWSYFKYVNGMWDERPLPDITGNSYTYYADYLVAGYVSDIEEIRIRVYVTDSEGAVSNVTWSVNVVNVNRPPVLITPINDIVVPEDTPYISLYLRDYFTDLDPEDNTSYKPYFGWNSTFNFLTPSLRDDFFNLTIPPNWFGTEMVNLTASDGKNNTTVTFNVTVTAVNDPPYIKQNIDNITINEDSIDSRLKFEDLFGDIDTSPLNFSFENSSVISISVSNGVITITPAPNYFGDAVLKLICFDGEFYCNLTIDVHIQSQPDPPRAIIVSPTDMATFTNADKITFEGLAEDPDPEDADINKLVFKWEDNKVILGLNSTLRDRRLTVGEHLITLTVSDSYSLEGSMSITVIINEAPEGNTDNNTNTGGGNKSPGFESAWILSAFAAGLFLLYMIRRKCV